MLEHFSLQTRPNTSTFLRWTTSVCPNKKVSPLPVTFIKQPHRSIQLELHFSSCGTTQRAAKDCYRDASNLGAQKGKRHHHENKLLCATDIKMSISWWERRQLRGVKIQLSTWTLSEGLVWGNQHTTRTATLQVAMTAAGSHGRECQACIV